VISQSIGVTEPAPVKPEAALSNSEGTHPDASAQNWKFGGAASED
jgi:hypothetical protein